MYINRKIAFMLMLVLNATFSLAQKGMLRNDTIFELNEVSVTGKSKARQLREQAMPVAILTTAQLAGSVTDVSDILNKTMGMTLRSQGGVGSTTRISVRGLEGKRIGFYIDEVPMNDNSDFIDVNDIPISMIERIEIYKGVVPVKFGGSSMGGAVNIVLKEYPPRFMDLGYAIESFNTHKATAILKRNLSKHGIEIGGGGFYTHSDNDYTMDSPYQKGLKIKRDHDKFNSIAGAIGIKARKWYFDELKINLEGLINNKQIQGIYANIRQAHTKSKVLALETSMKRKDFIVEGLDLDMEVTGAIAQVNYIDTALMRYDWDMIPYPSLSKYGGEVNDYPSDSRLNKKGFSSSLNLNYIITAQHAINFNSHQIHSEGQPNDPLKEKAIGYRTKFNSTMNSLTLGISHDFKSKDDRLLNSLTGKYYFYSMDTRLSNIYKHEEITPVNIRKHYWGITEAVRYRLAKDLMAKASVGYEVRTPTETELVGDGHVLSPSPALLPERGTNVNVGLLWDKLTKNGIFQLEVNFFGSILKDMIRQQVGIVTTQYENFGQMRSLGAEAEVKSDMLPWLYGYVNLTYQDLRDIRKNEFNSTLPNPTYNLRLPNIPYFMGNVGLEFHKTDLFGRHGTNTRLFADMSYVEEYFYDFEQSIYQERRIPRSMRIDIGWEETLFNGKVIFNAKIGNLANAKLFSEFNYPLPGRTFSLRLRYILK